MKAGKRRLALYRGMPSSTFFRRTRRTGEKGVLGWLSCLLD